MSEPPKWKNVIIVWLAIYPTITFVTYLIGDKIKNLPLPIKTLIMTGLLVPLMVYVLLPFLKKIMANWLNK